MFTESTSLKWTMYVLDFLASIQLHNSLCGPGDTTSMKGSSPLLTHTTLRPLVWWLEYLYLALFFSIIKALRPSRRLNKNTTLISREKWQKKIWVKNSWKRWGFVKIEFLDKNLTFRIQWPFKFQVIFNVTGVVLDYCQVNRNSQEKSSPGKAIPNTVTMTKQVKKSQIFPFDSVLQTLPRAQEFQMSWV